MKTPLIVCFALVFFSSGYGQAELPPYPKVTPAVYNDMAGTVGFYYGQLIILQQLSKKYPEMADDVARAQAQFDLSFKRSVDSIDAILTKENPKWPVDREKGKQIAEPNARAEVETFSADKARAYIGEVLDRARGNMPSPYIETLLIYHPDLLNRPHEEFSRGFKSILSTRDNPKAAGLCLRLELPRSWKVKEGLRPHVVSSYSSENGRGLEGGVLLIKVLPLPPDYKMSDSEVEEVLDQQALKAMVPPGGRFRAAKRMTLEGLLGAILEFDIEESRLDVKIPTRCVMFLILYEKSMITMQFMVSVPSEEGGTLDARFRMFEPLFRLIANSLVIENRWAPTTPAPTSQPEVSKATAPAATPPAATASSIATPAPQPQSQPTEKQEPYYGFFPSKQGQHHKLLVHNIFGFSIDIPSTWVFGVNGSPPTAVVFLYPEGLNTGMLSKDYETIEIGQISASDLEQAQEAIMRGMTLKHADLTLLRKPTRTTLNGMSAISWTYQWPSKTGYVVVEYLTLVDSSSGMRSLAVRTTRRDYASRLPFYDSILKTFQPFRPKQ